jgi:hypothetical protein
MALTAAGGACLRAIDSLKPSEVHASMRSTAPRAASVLTRENPGPSAQIEPRIDAMRIMFSQLRHR